MGSCWGIVVITLYQEGSTGTQFDFMISLREHEPSPKEIGAFRNVLLEDVRASRSLENMIYESRKRNRDHHTLFHRKLTLDDISM